MRIFELHLPDELTMRRALSSFSNDPGLNNDPRLRPVITKLCAEYAGKTVQSTDLLQAIYGMKPENWTGTNFVEVTRLMVKALIEAERKDA